MNRRHHYSEIRVRLPTNGAGSFQYRHTDGQDWLIRYQQDYYG
ncbi:MAG: hypothetical protein NTW29_03015 [Bacteroidetes bacterium]|nr:hypothetical protein [Bacteroidota bacterium]